jgi:hypothetical protein
LEKIAFWDIAPCSLIEVDLSFRGSISETRPKSARLHGAMSRKAVTFITAAVRSGNRTTQFRKKKGTAPGQVNVILRTI